MERGEAVALMSDAGTPLVSDPGFKLARAVVEGGGRIVPIPGAFSFARGSGRRGPAERPFSLRRVSAAEERSKAQRV